MMGLALTALFLCYIDRVIISLAAIEMQADLGWSNSDKSSVLAIFFLGYLIMQLLGGLLANKFGGRNIFLWAVLIWSIFTMVTPLAAEVSFTQLILARFMVGFGEGAAYPALYSMINKWMRKDEVSSSIGFMTAASTGGTIFAFLVAGKIIAIYGWPSVFYLFGALGFVWAVFWLWKIPAQSELSDDREADHRKTKRKIPWLLFVTHPAVLSLYVIAMSGAMVSYTLVAWMPSYFADTFGVSTTKAGIYSLFPFALLTFSAIAAGLIGDRYIKKGASTLKVRKRLTYIGFILCVIFIASLVLIKNEYLAILFLSFAFASLGIAVPGYSVMPAEMLPRHGDILYGFVAGVGTLASLVTIKLTGTLLDKTGSYDQMFLIMAAGGIIGLIVFAVFATNKPIYGEEKINV
nr:MFS transporter [Hellea sp.]